MSKYYDVQKLYGNPLLYFGEFNKYCDDMYFWPQIIQEYNSKSLIEIGCGTGRVAKLVVPLVKKYTGLDFSKEFIDFFKSNNCEIINQYNVGLINQDMKNININEIYDMIILPFNVFVYLYTEDDVKSFFLGIERISKKNTIVVIDLTNNQNEDFIKTNYRLCNRWIDKNNNKIKLYEKHTYDIKNKIINYSKKYVYEENKKEIILKLPVKVYTVKDFIDFADQYNFEIEKIYGDYDKSEYSTKSRKQIIILRKK